MMTMTMIETHGLRGAAAVGSGVLLPIDLVPVVPASVRQMVHARLGLDLGQHLLLDGSHGAIACNDGTSTSVCLDHLHTLDRAHVVLCDRRTCRPIDCGVCAHARTLTRESSSNGLVTMVVQLQRIGLSLVMIVVQVCAAIWYAASYVYFAQECIKGTVKSILPT